MCVIFFVCVSAGKSVLPNKSKGSNHCFCTFATFIMSFVFLGFFSFSSSDDFFVFAAGTSPRHFLAQPLSLATNRHFSEFTLLKGKKTKMQHSSTFGKFSFNKGPFLLRKRPLEELARLRAFHAPAKFPESSPEFPQVSPEFPPSFPDFPRDSPNFPEFPRVSPRFPEIPRDSPEIPPSFRRDSPEIPRDSPSFPDFPRDSPSFPEIPRVSPRFPEIPPRFPEIPPRFPEIPRDSPRFPEIPRVSPSFPEIPRDSPTFFGDVPKNASNFSQKSCFRLFERFKFCPF